MTKVWEMPEEEPMTTMAKPWEETWTIRDGVERIARDDGPMTGLQRQIEFLARHQGTEARVAERKQAPQSRTYVTVAVFVNGVAMMEER